jgi:diacylglycerol kinase (ATP)
MSKMKFSFRSRVNGFKYAYDGIVSLFKNEHNSRIHLTTAALVAILGILLHLSPVEWVSIVIVTGLVFITELINSAIERFADFFHPEEDQVIKQIKDYGAASVLISAIVALTVGGLIFIPRLMEIIKYKL